MKKYRITLLSMLVISSVFCISFPFSIQLPSKGTTAYTLEDDGELTAEEKITEETTEEAIVRSFSYKLDIDDEPDYFEADNKNENEDQNLDENDIQTTAITLEQASVEFVNTEQEAVETVSQTIYANQILMAMQVESLADETAGANENEANDEVNYEANNEETDPELAKDEPYEEEEAESKYANIGISMAKDYVNIRKKATTNSESLGKLYRNSACTILEELDGWYYVESGSVTGYVKAEYIKTGIPDDELIQKYGTQKIKVTVDGLNVRKEPTTESKRLTVIYKNEKYPLIETIDDWYKIEIEDEDIEGYVKAEHTELIVTFKYAVSKQEEERLKEIQAEERAKKETVVKYRGVINYTDEDLKLLACLVHAEAGTQSYEGKLAVANVVINRVKSSKYPNTIKGVIYQKGQFSVASSGSLQKQLNNYAHFKSSSQKLSIKAAREALEGANNIGSRLYFNSYKAAVKKGYLNKPNCIKIDDHLFW